MGRGTGMKAVVMAGGEGSRLRPITAARPKPLVPVCNVPIMEHIVGLLRRHEMQEIVCTLHYLADEVQSYFDGGDDFGVSISYSIEDTPLGTAGSVKLAEARLRDGAFVIISGDALTDCDLTQAIAFHREKGGIATLILCRVPNPLDFGVVIVDENSRVTRFLEKPGWSEVFSDTVNTGMYILEPEVFDILEPGKVYDWSQDVFPELLRLGKSVYGYVMPEGEYWSDVGTLPQYREAQEHLLVGRAKLAIPGKEVRPGVWVGDNTVLDEDANVEAPVCIGANCRVKKRATIGPYTVLGQNIVVEEGAHVERSVVWDGSYIGAGASLRSAIVCSKVIVKRDVVVGEDVVIGDRCLVDAGATLRPNIKLWPDKIIERGSTVTMSLVWGHKWRGGLFRELGVAGLSNVEITPEFATRLGAAFGSTLPPRSNVVTSRDSTRSSRMIKRAMIASLLSVGCNVLDLRSAAVPIARHFIRSSGAAGAVNVRKLPGNARVTLIELLDHNGAYLSKSHERKVETQFFREDYHRVDSEDIGVIDFAGRAVEEYQNDYFRLLAGEGLQRRMRIVCDYGYSPVSAFFPSMLARLGVESISVNGYNDAKLAPRTPDEIQKHLNNLRQIVGILNYDLGVLFTEDDERLTIVDDRGRLIVGNTLLASLALLAAEVHPGAKIALTLAAPDRLVALLQEKGAQVIRTKVDTRSLMSVALSEAAMLGGDDRGGFVFPALHPGFDAMFGLGQFLILLQRSGQSLSDLVARIPEFHVAYDQARCPWEAKGRVMRQLAESHSLGETVELLDGIKFHSEGGWTLVLPDAVEPVIHVYAEAESEEDSERRTGAAAALIQELQTRL